MASVDVVDETFLVVDRSVLAARLADPAQWAALWPDLALTVFTDRGDAGIRWSVTGAWIGSMEIWLEPVADGTVLHWFLRVDPAGGPLRPREATREALRRQRASKRLAFALKAELERGRAPGEPRRGGVVIWHVVSDVHGNADALARAGTGADALLVLGDLLDLVDYDDPQAGILGELVGPEGSREFARVRSSGAPGEMRRVVSALWATVEDPRARVLEAVRAQYDRLFGVLADVAATVPTYLTPGNVDVPAVWPAEIPGVTVVDGGVADIGGVRVGFVGGVPLPAGVEPRTGVFPAYLRRRESYDAAVADVVEAADGRLDVLASHAPPEDAELAYDVAARHREASSPALRAAIADHRPRAALFGHVHAPLAARRRIGATECVNAGHFRRRGTPIVLRW